MKSHKKWLGAFFSLLFITLVAQAGEWIADQKGCKVWNQNPGPGESITWSGACQNGYATGHGVLAWFEAGKPGEKYEGEMLQGKINGKGSKTWPESTRNCGTNFCRKKYSGEWRNDQPTCGKTDYWNGDSYEGCYENNGSTMKGKTKFQMAENSRKHDQTRNCQHIYVGRSVSYSTDDLTKALGGLTGVVLGFSAQRGVATLRPSYSYDPVEVLCTSIEE